MVATPASEKRVQLCSQESRMFRSTIDKALRSAVYAAAVGMIGYGLVQMGWPGVGACVLLSGIGNTFGVVKGDS
jgi:hypothetical protein